MTFSGASYPDHGTDAEITAAEAEKMRNIRSGTANVLSLYLPVLPERAELPGLPALTGDLIDAAVTAGSLDWRARVSQGRG